MELYWKNACTERKSTLSRPRKKTSFCYLYITHQNVKRLILPQEYACYPILILAKNQLTYIILIAQILKGSVWTHIDNSVWKYRLTVQKNSSNLYVSCFAEGSVDGLIRKCKFSNCSNANVKRARIVFVTEQFCRHVGRQSDKNCFSLLFAIVHHPIKNAQVA